MLVQGTDSIICTNFTSKIPTKSTEAMFSIQISYLNFDAIRISIAIK